MSIGGFSGQVLGASTSMAAGVMILPYTGINTLSAILPIVAIGVGFAVLCTLIVTRIIRIVR
ncbi:hypothetical protein A3C23_03215 [Candidatus Roizmanbacteria bacterium RIFCSPHIGHO2_02_FULL_37_13b]|uniref:Uncharacterized protein n=1 Tax=Candidatus Roizmanbacteria bacterium RIFCSPLOWO2_02_FULL_36_11 TaxID=1802071 RepID=A0A1F7JGI9_9BACT|nr:MAG: hypothetical protein A3C23_03215 [Candidatus Roizmanbacteria bacterium RIFCSPHIGHO2_02_FULL_37_13b]OGK54730.1 MAG: hypothetical protein A3H78_05565 [Candidatus Roizmanbacteria bacterium RIFCSPLOWO2_02_FULL_36_11]